MSATENGIGTAQPPSITGGRPWAHVSASAMVEALTEQVGAQSTEMAAMRIYIDQLHEALDQMRQALTATDAADEPVT